MAQTFDIRFARSAGLAALLEVPENAFRWKGGGSLHIDAHGISIGLNRGLLALLGGKHTQRIPTQNLRAVYREGDALRVEFQNGESERVVLPFWANDRDAAAQIVRLLPTSQTVEMEEATPSAKPRADWRMLLTLGAAVAAIALGAWAVYQRNSLEAAADTEPMSEIVVPVELRPVTPASTSTPADAAHNAAISEKPASPRPWYEAPAIPLEPYRSVPPTSLEPIDLPASRIEPSENETQNLSPAVAVTSNVESTPRTWVVRVSADGVVPIVPGMPSYAAARRQLDLFLAESNTLRGYYLDYRDHLSGRRQQDLQELWWKVSVRISNSLDFEDPALKPLQEIELAVSRAWRRALSMSADGGLVASAPAEFHFAEMLEARATQFVQ